MACERMTRYTPAVTIVAAWMRAETGVGPSIASSSHDCSGTCADLPQAPTSRSMPSSVTHAGDIFEAPALTASNELEPNIASIVKIAIVRPRSPTRLTTNAFLPAVDAVGLCCQNEMSRYEARPTPSQPTNSTA